MVRVAVSSVSSFTAGHSTQGPSCEDGSERSLPIRTKNPHQAAVSLHPLASQNGVIIKVSPPREPTDSRLSHVPCDIVLVIDVSGSMGVDAPVPSNPGEVQERTGLSVLDLVKHSARTILETLDASDRLGIVTFASKAKVLQKLLPMNESNKKKTRANIDSMRPIDQTNLWHGICEGIDLFDAEVDVGRVPAIMILTDGLPNHMEPAQGYIPKLRKKGPLPASLHTFGFGYSLKSGLLKSVAEFGCGNYSFIPDAGMIGTVFVHAIANLQSTFANNATLRLTYPSSLNIQQTTGSGVDVHCSSQVDEGRKELTITLGNIQYGQSRDIYLRFIQRSDLSPDSTQPIATYPMMDLDVSDLDSNFSGVDTPATMATSSGMSTPTMTDFESVVDTASEADVDVEFEIANEPRIMTAILEYTRMTSTVIKTVAHRDILDVTNELGDAEIAYHKSRSQICEFISTLFPLRWDEEHERVPYSESFFGRLNKLIRAIPAANYIGYLNSSLMQDLAGPSPRGQISLALSRKDYYDKWGFHYLPSLQNAHAKQLCNTFKDPGPLQYGTDSPLFIKCRDRLDAVFDSLPAPKPSNVRAATASRGSRISMSRYHRSSNPCFASFCEVLLADGEMVRMGKLRRGMAVVTPKGPRKVAAVLKTRVRREMMVKFGGCVVTAWHPVRTLNGQWTFPGQISPGRVRYSGSIYSILLQEDADVDAHAVMIGGLWGVTLGHGLLRGSDVRVHQFLGSYCAVSQALASLGPGKQGVVLGGGVVRDRKSSHVCGFRRPLPTVAQIRRTANLILRKTCPS